MTGAKAYSKDFNLLSVAKLKLKPFILVIYAVVLKKLTHFNLLSVAKLKLKPFILVIYAVVLKKKKKKTVTKMVYPGNVRTVQ